MAPKGYLALVLHAHLPFVRHPEHERFLEETWLFEAITETYLPLLRIMDGWERDGVEWRLTMSMTPTLCSMLDDVLLRERYLQHLGRLVLLADREVERTRTLPEFHTSALMYQRAFQQCREDFDKKYKRNITGAFRHHMEAGHLEIITCGATHGFLPLMQNHPEAVNAQVGVAVSHYKKTFGRAPQGIWNAECGYYPGLDKALDRHGLKYFFVDSHGILFGTKRPRYGVFAPIRTPGGPYAFGRDQESSRAVWSAKLGYPGDPRYREFYRDIGFDLDINYLRPTLGDIETRSATGIKYHRISGDHKELHDKEPYVEQEARDAAAQHAGHFLFSRQQQILHLDSLMAGQPPLIVSPYDAELFGHWWYEGPSFLDQLVRKIHFDQQDIALLTPSEYLEKFPGAQESTPSMSSWGYGGYSEVWLEGSNDWIYRHLEKTAERMIDLARRHENPDALTRRALNQCARELLLAQASDWAFIMKTNTVVDYARKRTETHIGQFIKLFEMIESGTIDESVLAIIESRDNIFEDIDYRLYAPLNGKV
ncbi:MAG: 1,4-alpha-glucan branching enzyme [Candidatus Sumerlaeota bacterium]|nr:1,4-alpha-glucan branching enzyme [Candidatus Sumerlaeota bacterium]